MKVLLMKSVEDLGIGGEVVNVTNGYARNFLFPRNLAIKATPSAVKSAQFYRAKALEEQAETINQSELLAEKLSGLVLEITSSSDDSGHLYGSVTERHISDVLKEAGFDIDAEHVLLSEHIKDTGEFPVPVKVYGDIRSEIIVKILPETD
ncbi:MAG: 50S ribosomal protein L9 [Candidatus Fermentibacteraceae bacterium]|nr:50S ribosomal protein L9 [Candidatus Fermentibacteraceae bacterium]